MITFFLPRRHWWRAAAVLALGAAGGCSSHPRPSYSAQERADAAADMAIVDSISDSGVRSAIIVQHALFPYHFAPDSDSLDELGERDLAVLMSHYRSMGGGELSIRRGDTPEALYTARVHRVQQVLRRGGVDLAAVRIVDMPAGGEGIASTEAFRALNRTAKQQAYEPADMTRSGLDTGSGGASNQNGGIRQ